MGDLPGLGEGQLEEGAAGELIYDEPTPGGEPEGAEPEPTFDIDGRAYPLSELRGFIKGGMLERDYRVKTSELSEQRKSLEEAAKAWEILNEYPELMQALGQKLSEILQGGSGEAAVEPEVPEVPDESAPWRKDIQGFQSQVSQLLTAQDKRLQEYNKYAWDNYYAQRNEYARSNIVTLRETYPELREDEVVEAFVNNHELNLEELAKLSHEYWAQEWSNRQKRDIDKRKANARKQVEVPRSPGVAGTKSETPKDYDEARKSALERLSNAVGFRKS